MPMRVRKPGDIEAFDRHLMLQDKRDLELGRNLAFSFAKEFLLGQNENVVCCIRKKSAYARFKDLVERHNALTRSHELEAK